MGLIILAPPSFSKGAHHGSCPLSEANTTLGTEGQRPDGCHTPLCAEGAGPYGNTAAPPTGIYCHWQYLLSVPRSFADAQYSGHMSSLFFEEIYCFFLKKCNLNTPPGKSIFLNIFRRSIFLFQRYHYFVIGIQLMFIQ